MKTMKFLLLGGRYRTGGVSYKKGDVVESEHDLVESIVNKFKRLSDTAAVTPAGPKRLSLPEKRKRQEAKLAEKLKAEKLAKEAKAKERLEDPMNPANLKMTKEPEKEEKEPDPKKLVAVHKGAGMWDVIRSDTDEKINDKLLSREEAEKLAGKRK